jgi:hypothetical protein
MDDAVRDYIDAITPEHRPPDDAAGLPDQELRDLVGAALDGLINEGRPIR